MNNYEYVNYEELKKIEDSNFISTLQEIKTYISNPFSLIPNRINCINLLRSICKYRVTYFFNFFWGIRYDFKKNCLDYKDNPKLQQISVLFLNEIINYIYNEIPHGNINIFISWAYESIFIYLKSKNNFLKIGAEKLIKEMAENIPTEAIPVSLISSLKEKDEKIVNFIYNCIELYFKEFVSYGINFDFIINRLEINNIINDKNNQDYYLKIKKAFILLKNIIESQGIIINSIIEGLTDKNKVIFNELIK